jgi:hypothetical protein
MESKLNLNMDLVAKARASAEALNNGKKGN